jgi:putative lysine transport system substrate-binding protein
MAKVIGQQPAANSAPAEAELVIDLAVPGKEDYFIA